jgi:signal peptidase II
MGVILFDQLGKHLAPKSWVYYNEGLIFGSLSDLPSTIRVLTLCSMGGFFATVYLFLTMALSKGLRLLHLGMGLLIGGVFGNIIDRTLMGKTIDFIPITLGDHFLVFNLADVAQWVGAALITYKLLTKEKLIWFPDNQRGKVIVLLRDQLYFAGKVTLSCFCCSVLLGLFSLTFFRLSLVSLHLESAQINLYMSHFALGLTALSVLFCLLIFGLSLYLSHKMAGPLYAFELYVEELLGGGKRRLRLREGDQSRHLVKIADQLHEHFHHHDKAS